MDDERGAVMVSGPIAVKAKDIDNVATVFADDVVDGTLVMVHDAGGNQAPISVIGDIPYGHKIALRDIAKGEQIVKYGEEIGVATHDIRTGEYVHVHNLDSMRGRGDLERGA